MPSPEQEQPATGIRARLGAWHVGGRGVSLAAYIVAIVLFVLAALGVDIGDAGELRLVAWGLAAFALGHILP